MASSNINLGVLIDSKISSSFGSSINTANEKLNSLGSSVENLNNKKVGVNIDDMTSKLNIASANLKKLQNEKMHLEVELETASFDTDTEKISKRISDLDLKIAKLNSYKTLLDFDLKDARSKIGETTKELTKLEKILQSTNKHKLNIETQAQKRDDLKKGIFDKLALGASVAVPIKVAMEFESKMADVNKVVDFGSKEELKLFEKDILKLTRTIPLSANALAEITASGGQLGIAKEELLSFTTTVAKMSTAFNMSAKVAGDSIAKLMNVYGMNTKEATKLGDAINHISDSTAAKASDMVEVLGRVGGTAKVFGLTAVETSALASSLLALGKTPEVAATGINALLLKLSTADKQGEKFQKALSSIGFSAIDLKEKIDKNANGAILEFLEAIKQLDKSEKMGVLSDLFGAEYSDDIALLTEGLNEYKKAINLTANEHNYLGSMQREFETRSATSENNMQLLKNSLNEIAINFGNIFLPPLNLAISALRYFTTTVVDLMNASPIIGGLIKTVAGLFGAFITVSVGGTALAYVMTFVSSGFSRLALLGNLLKLAYVGLASGTALATAKTFLYATAQKVATASSIVFGSALKIVGSAIGFVSKTVIWLGRALLLNPIGLLITAIGVAAYTIYTYWEPIKGFFSNLWDNIKSVFNSGITFVKEYLGWTPLGLILNNWEPILNFFSNLWDNIKVAFNSGLTFVKEYLGWTPLGLILNNWEPISNFFSSLWDGIKSIFSSSWENIKSILSFNPFEIIYNAWSGVFDWFSSKFEFVGKGIEKLKNLGATVGDWFGFGDKEDVLLQHKNTLALANVGGGYIQDNPYSVWKEPLNVGDGYTQALEKTVNSETYKTNNTNYTNNTSKSASDVSSIVINVNNPVVQDKEQAKVLEQDIKKVVNAALKEKEQSYKNRTLKDIE